MRVREQVKMRVFNPMVSGGSRRWLGPVLSLAIALAFGLPATATDGESAGPGPTPGGAEAGDYTTVEISDETLSKEIPPPETRTAAQREEDRQKQASPDPTPDEIKALQDARGADIELMIRRTEEFRQMVDGVVLRTYKMKRSRINDSYRSRLRAEEASAQKARLQAIAYFEKFLKKYPDNPVYTPDAMYRLAELYYDDSYVQYQDRLEQYAIAQDEGRADAIDPPVKEFDRTVAVFRDLIAKYPQYRSIDGAYYVLGYCLNETGREEEARLAWLNLVCANKFKYDSKQVAIEKAQKRTGISARPAASLETGTEARAAIAFADPFAGCKPVAENSRFFFETWWLIGNYHFDYDSSRYGVETAISAYKNLVSNPEHKFYDKGLYKLAWSYFKADMYPEAIDAFSKVVDFSDAEEGAKGTGMRPEAIQYLAVCFFTEDWNLDLKPDADTGIERVQDPRLMPQDRNWTREVYARLGDIYSDNEKNLEAIAVWELFMEKWPLELESPFIQEKIAIEYGKMRLPEKEIAARSALERFAPGSEWWQKFGDHPVEQNQVARMTRNALLEAAYHFHRTAQSSRQRGLAAQNAVLLERAIAEYGVAADAYRKFIDQNPDTPDAYDINFNLAETLFWSGRYEEAREEYRKVRDSNLDVKYRGDAGYMVIVCTEEIMKKEIASGALVLRETPPPVEGDPPAEIPLPLPPILLELMNEREAFIKDNPEHKEASSFKYQSAQNYYRYGHWDEAKIRYEEIYDAYCKKDPMAYIAWQTMMNMAADLNDLNEKERLALLQKEKTCQAEGIEDIVKDGAVINIETVLGDVAMQRALDALTKCLDEKTAEICSAAADGLVAAVDKAPAHPNADKALHNAALAYEIAQRFDSAMKLYGRIVAEYPKSEFVGKCLFQQASAANNFFEYDKALENYKLLADEERFKGYQNRTVSVYNTAYILTNLQSYMAAIPYWQRYAAEEQDRPKSIEASFNAADMYYRAGKWGQAIKAYNDFIKRYERDADAGPWVVKASYRIGLSQAKLKPAATGFPAEWTRTVNLYERLAPEPGSMSAEYAAHSQFMLIEQDMRGFEKFKISGNQKAIDSLLREGAEKVKAFEDRYRQIQSYRRPEWSLAAEFRIGYAYEVYAKAILNIPVPALDKDTQKLLRKMLPEDRALVLAEYEDKFRAAMEEQVSNMEAKAQAEYKIAVDLARRGNISNEWTLLALERMNAYDPDNFPRQHNGVIEVEESNLVAPPLAGEVE